MKNNLLSTIRRAVLGLAAFTFATATHAQTIPNPSFEANSFVNFPGYVFTPGNGGIAGWAINGAVGLNPAGGSPFADNGAVPQGSNVAFIQSVNLPGNYGNGVSVLNTVITGLTPGVSYTVSFRANSRTSSFYGAPTPSWSVNGAAFLPFTAAPSVGGPNAYYTVTRTFTATAATAALNIMNNTAVTGGPADTAVLVDDFQIAIVPPVVTNANDSGPGSLRQMLAYAATIPGANTVTFDPALSGATITLGSEIDITDAASVTIDASSLAAGLTISGNSTNRIFYVGSGRRLGLKSLTLTGGNGVGSAFSGNGGAIMVTGGTLEVALCTFTGNAASGEGSGGAIYNFQAGNVTLNRCTLSQNSSPVESGGAIYNDVNCSIALTHCTISGNSATRAGALLFYGSPTLTNCIVAGNTASTAPDVYGISPVIQTGVNFIGNLAESGLTASATVLTTAANGPINLGPLASNGGPTQTMLPLAGSPAIDAAVSSTATSDQRGVAIAGVPDLGAAENGSRITVATEQFDTPAGAQVSLREAVRDCPSGGVVVFAAALSGQTLPLASEITPAQSSLRIDASNLPAGATIDGGPDTNRIFTVSTGKSLALLGLTLTGGNGGGLLQDGNGGAIVNFGTLALTRCTLTGNSRTDRSGGAILNDGGTLTLTQCTLVENAASNGGAIFQTSGTLSLTHCTLSGNLALDTGGAIYCAAGTVTLASSIVTGNTVIFSASDMWSAATSIATGVNYIGNPFFSGYTAGPTILTTPANGPINLAPLGNYGGPTQTIALQPGSPARNAATGSTITSDQRGFPIVNTPDIGAYEAGTLGTNYNAYIWETLPITADAPQHASGVDFDGDGASNFNEWLAQTSAANPASLFRISALPRSGNNVTVIFPTVVGRNYSVEYADALATPTVWTSLPDVTSPGNGLNIGLPLDVTTLPSPIFFRIRVGP